MALVVPPIHALQSHHQRPLPRPPLSRRRRRPGRSSFFDAVPELPVTNVFRVACLVARLVFPEPAVGITLEPPSIVARALVFFRLGAEDLDRQVVDDRSAEELPADADGVAVRAWDRIPTGCGQSRRRADPA